MKTDVRSTAIGVGVLALAFILATALFAGTGPATETTQDSTEIDSCTTITESGTYELTIDIEDSDANDCLRIETDGVTLEGNGHLVEGEDHDDTFGVLVVADTVDPITVRNFTVRDWEEGVRITQGETTVENVEATSNVDGVNARRLIEGVRFERIHAHDNADDGVEIIDVTEFFVVESHSTNNEGDGIYLDDADDGEVQNNLVENNGDNGVHGFDPDMTGIAHNEIRDNDEDGIHVHARGASGARGEDMSIWNNTITDNGDEGIHLIDLRRVGGITDNTVCENDDKQLLLEDIPNIRMSGNVITC